MRRGFKTTIFILDFIRTGKFGVVEIGQLIDVVKEEFPKPDDISEMDKNIYIWRYGAFEFHFVDGILTLLWCDNLNFMYSPRRKQFKLDRWILGKYKDGCTLTHFIEELNNEGLEFKMYGTYYSSDPKTDSPDNVILEIENTTTEIYFEDINEDATSYYDYKLIAIGSTSFAKNGNRYKSYML